MNVLYFDTETTGLKSGAKACEIAWIEVDEDLGPATKILPALRRWRQCWPCC